MKSKKVAPRLSYRDPELISLEELIPIIFKDLNDFEMDLWKKQHNGEVEEDVRFGYSLCMFKLRELLFKNDVRYEK